MSSNSTQRRLRTIRNETELARARGEHNLVFVSENGQHIEKDQRYNYFLTPEEERLLLKDYEYRLKKFCDGFAPPIPKRVVEYAFLYFKRFYVFNSIMNYHPTNILITCVYFACQIKNYKISETRFLLNIEGDREKAACIISKHQSLLLRKLSNPLAIHHLKQKFSIAIKIRSPHANLKRLKSGIDNFLEKAFLTDVYLLYTPSQTALAAYLHAACEEYENLGGFVIKMISKDADSENADDLIEILLKIQSMVKMVKCPNRETVTILEKKLNRCCNESALKIKKIIYTV